jgi:hypothetical protein
VIAARQGHQTIADQVSHSSAGISPLWIAQPTAEELPAPDLIQ